MVLQLLLEADGTRAPQDARRGRTRRGGGGRNSLNITFLMHDARRAAWRRRRVAVARPVRIAIANLRSLPRFEKKPEIGQVPERSSLSCSNHQTGVGVFC